ncbi:MAG: MFS transporter [Bryobacterales bacterium]|nr:MFS transporter [Bryobacterales bacterium]
MPPPERTTTPVLSKNAAPSRTRYFVVLFAVTLAILSYIDRVAISKAAPFIIEDLHLTKDQMGLIFGSFALAYALAEIPGGWLGDYMGPRRVLMRIVIWWSFFTASAGWMWSFWSLRINQFLFGLGEAGCFPNLTKAFTTWLQPHERVRAQGIMWMAARWGGAITPLLCVTLYQFMNWRIAFAVFALLGVVWAILFYRWFRDNPKDHPSVNAAEWELLEPNQKLIGSHGDVPWGKMIRSRSVVFLWIQYFLITYPWYFFITWLSTYLEEAKGLGKTESAWYAIFPLFFGGIGCISSGFLLPHVADWMGGNVRRARRVVAMAGFFGASAFMLLCIQQQNPLLGMLAMGMASFCNDLVMPCAWGACMDVGGKYAGTVSGSMNMFGNFAGFFAPWVGGVILTGALWGGTWWPADVIHLAAQNISQWTGIAPGDYRIFLYTMAAAYFLGALCWPFIDPVTPMEHEAAHHD